jgi:putative ABC transport system permease protein
MTSNSLHIAMVVFKCKGENAMLKLKDIIKSYQLGTNRVQALKGINLNFRNQEFVSILGPSGCGKTTLLNLIGGLDHMDSGDLIIDGISTKDYKDSDWDRYRNEAIGFVFQSYNLISHLSVLDNVAMSLALTGVRKKERTYRASQVLTQVGLEEHMNKKPNQLSGGQMQRVAIARALINNPKILLADEPTGALDTETSESIMSLIQSLSQDRCVIMVTHNAEIAQTYSSRIIQLKDGLVVNDSNPFEIDDKPSAHMFKSVSMSYATALYSSFKNLLTKKGRTMITSFAGSIGIIGIALVLALSNGMDAYVSSIESETLAGFPLQLNQNVSVNDFSDRPAQVFRPQDSEALSQGLVVDASTETVSHVNVFDQDAMDFLKTLNPSWINSISYQRSMTLNVATTVNDTPTFVQTVLRGGDGPLASNQSLFFELPADQEFVLSLYDLVAGTYPTQSDEALFVIADDSTLDQSVVNALYLNLSNPFDFDELLKHSFTFIAHDVLYQVEDQRAVIQNLDQNVLNHELNQEIKIVGVLRLKEDSGSSFLNVGVGTIPQFNEAWLAQAQSSQISMLQLEEENINVLTGLPFNAFNTYETALKSLGADLTPQSILIYPRDFESKTLIKEAFDTYNDTVEVEDELVVSDIAESLSSTISSLINTITLILSAFAAISLVVSSIMIGIITYVSVIERTKEIGIMRSLGARKKDISRIFNAEAMIIGILAGTIGIGLTYLILIGVDRLIESLLGIANFSSLPTSYALILIALSATLTLIAGFLPSKMAANQDPVVALRTE